MFYKPAQVVIKWE